MFTDLVESSTETARLLLKQRTFYNRRFAVLVEASTKTVKILTRWNLPNALLIMGHKPLVFNAVINISIIESYFHALLKAREK